MTKETEEDGIKAVIFLQKFAGIDEPYEKAKKGWNGMSLSEKETTMKMYHLLNKCEKCNHSMANHGTKGNTKGKCLVPNCNCGEDE